MILEWGYIGLVGVLGMGFGVAWRAKTSPAEMLQHPVRRTLLLEIGGHPGARPSTLRRVVESNRGTTDYHLMILERAGAVRVVRHEHSTRFFPADATSETLVLAPLLLRGRVLDLVRRILALPGISQHELTRELRMSRKVFREYANLLGPRLIREERKERKRHYYPTYKLRDVLRQIASWGFRKL